MDSLWKVFVKLNDHDFEIPEPQLRLFFAHFIVLNVNRPRRNALKTYLKELIADTICDFTPCLAGLKSEDIAEDNVDTAWKANFPEREEMMDQLLEKSKKWHFAYMLEENVFFRSFYQLVIKNFPLDDENKYFKYFRLDASKCEHE